MSAASSQSSPLYATYARAELAFERGEGVWLETTSGERFLDLMGGIAVNAFGHAHPYLVEALKRQAEKLWHVSNIFEIPGQVELGRRLCEATFADRVFFTNSGGEAMECAIKTVRRYHHAKGQPQRNRIITFEGAFHGRTLATIAAGGQAKYLEGFAPKVEGFDQIAFADRDALKAAIGPETAGILVEPIQGEGGIRPVPHEFLRFIRELCDEHGLLMVLDEIQCGMGRTGRLFAHEWAGVTPDVMAIAKAIGGGFPLGACLATREASEAMAVGSHGSTYGGNPLAMAVGNAVLDLVLEDGFLTEVSRKGLLLKQKLARLVDAYPDQLKDVRGEGLMLGLVCAGAPAEMVARLRKHGVLTVGAGHNVVRVLPALIISEAEMDEGVNRIEAALRAAGKSAAA
ncbi:acetylornithine/N-succinyldiaminopimelate aminotransferase [Rhodopseudomonas julia]|uniref:Acetylornithine aminotransferase n=1 Tax=Rhodopseudomonas julia TaxID=200617 RepID=A0ABU0C3M2_9BRAD|nr:aspartate aminotransferase family protein [Rhodopseudomonas julia]MDQ0325099.1 acetylornithine/N-succinyldiaminopimelate aminotransferase [Rhodopseudomonas julia]